MKKKFEYKLTPLLWILFIAGLVLAGACVYYNVTRFLSLLKATDAGTFNYMGALLSAVIGLCAFVFIIPAMISSEYIVEEKYLISKWGLIKNKYEIKDITTVTHFRVTNKLVVYFTDESYTVINIDPKEFDAFVDALKENNKKIFFSLDTENKGEK